MNTYTLIGHLSNNKAIYISKAQNPSIEKDHSYLVTPTPAEMTEIYKIFPHLKPMQKIQGQASKGGYKK